VCETPLRAGLGARSSLSPPCLVADRHSEVCIGVSFIVRGFIFLSLLCSIYTQPSVQCELSAFGLFLIGGWGLGDGKAAVPFVNFVSCYQDFLAESTDLYVKLPPLFGFIVK
jgi:hypothetical protein